MAQGTRNTGGMSREQMQYYAQRQNGGGFQPQVKTQKKKKQAAKPKVENKLGRIDIPMLTIILLLLLFGLVMLFSASYPSGYMRRGGNSFAFISRQLQFAVIGVVAMMAASFIDYRLLKKFAWPLMLVGLVMLVVVLFMPSKNSAHRWIWINAATERGFQPSEIIKFAVILVFAKMIHVNQHRMKTFKYGFAPFMAILGVVSLLLILEPHLSCTILVLGIGMTMIFVGGAPVKWFALGGAGVVLAAFLAVTQFQSILPNYAFTRIAIWKDIFSVPAQDAYQTLQSLIAVGSGGINGRGIGNSVQKFLYLPEVYNDYIYAVVCEELGMIGGVAVMLLFLALLGRGIYIAMRARDKFGSMLVIGISVQIALQAFLHIAVNLNAIPSTGISLPFFSYGGSSLCMLLGQVGIMLSVSRQARIGTAAGGQADEEAEQPQPIAQMQEEVV